MEKMYTSKTVLKVAGGRMHTPHPTSLAIGYATETIKRVYPIFRSLGTINFVIFTKRQSQKGEAMAQQPPSLNTLLQTD